ncbi:MAG TPA: DUF1810 domain-containing protein [Chitinophagaceae bacterium]|nr:DUF1810 domain-containing protein [Chitinophagaceae bacterium]
MNITLNRFIEAQQSIYPRVLKELRNAKKTTHWMWFIFPQIEGLGHSSTAKYYSIKSIEEGKEYIAHPILGKRLLECSNIILNIDGKSASAIFGYPDDLKLRSSMTLFNYIVPQLKVFAEVLKKYFGGDQDERTIELLNNL